MSVILPRWEWRAFGPDFPTAAAVFADLETSAHDSDERYFLVLAGSTVKVRDGLMDIKALREVDATGLERWEPILKVPFPLSAEAVAEVVAALRLQPAVPLPPAATADEMADLLAAHGVRSVAVHKHRVRATIDGCATELTDVTANGRTTRTIAAESTDPGAVRAVAARIGLGAYRNTSYPGGLGRLLADAPRRAAVIDVGTNSVKFHVGELQPGGDWRAIRDRAEVTRLGEGLDDSGAIQPAPLERTITAIAGMVDEARSDGAAELVAVGTAGMRVATNQADVVAAIRDRTGVHVEVISGEEEARLAYLATMARLDLRDGGPVVIFDTGGGSTQFTIGTVDRIDRRFSLDIGAVRLTERFGLDDVVEPAVIDEVRQTLRDEFATLAGTPRPDALVGMGGAMTNLAAMHHRLAVYDPTIVDQTVLDRAIIDGEIEVLRTRDAQARREIVGLQPARAEVILAGACIVRAVMDALDAPSVTVSDRGLRHGLIVERFA
jgi:exopolyphosphatase/guanosine-5'-triphosphate,3'-diphosphate pyrophosphatase